MRGHNVGSCDGVGRLQWREREEMINLLFVVAALTRDRSHASRLPVPKSPELNEPLISINFSG